MIIRENEEMSQANHHRMEHIKITSPIIFINFHQPSIFVAIQTYNSHSVYVYAGVMLYLPTLRVLIVWLKGINLYIFNILYLNFLCLHKEPYIILTTFPSDINEGAHISSSSSSSMYSSRIHTKHKTFHELHYMVSFYIRRRKTTLERQLNEYICSNAFKFKRPYFLLCSSAFTQNVREKIFKKRKKKVNYT